MQSLLLLAAAAGGGPADHQCCTFLVEDDFVWEYKLKENHGELGEVIEEICTDAALSIYHSEEEGE